MGSSIVRECESAKVERIDFSLPVLSIRQPWAWLILHAGKDIENREWPTKFRGKFLIHAGKDCTKEEYWDAIQTAAMAFKGTQYSVQGIPALDQIQRGGIVGSVELIACVRGSTSKWFFGSYGFALRNPQPLPFHPMKGQLGFFKVQSETQKLLATKQEFLDIVDDIEKDNGMKGSKA